MLTDNDERKELFQNRIIYSYPVKLGLWEEDYAAKQQKVAITTYKREHCQLLVQKTKKMLRNLLQPTTLAYDAPYVLHGQNYQIKASDMPKNNPCSSMPDGLYLSGLITEQDIMHDQHFTHGCLLSGSTSKTPCVRNTFKLVGCNGNKEGQQVTYGEDVYIQIVKSAGLPLYIQCENSTIDTFGGHLSLRLSQSPDIYCRFKIFHWNPQLRFETSGTPFAPNTRVILQHTASGRNLAVEHTSWIPTFFGPECAISCHTYRDSHKMETAENFWKLISTPNSNTNLYVRAAKGENIAMDMLD